MAWAAGHKLQNGRYVIQEVLGQGGFGITYRVLHVRLDTDVVIKTPNEHLKHDPDYAEYVSRFIKEGRRMERFSQRSHPHVVRVRDLFEEGDVHCMVMDFVEGETLFQWVQRSKGAITEARVLPCIRQIGDALASIHQAGLVHRDAHPGNIMRRKDGSAVLIDFGIAKELVPTAQSSTGMFGNLGFAPYEQMLKGSREVAVDIYCLAASLYYGVTGEIPVASIVRKLDNVPLIAPQKYNRKLSNHVNQAIIQGMALEARDRPQSMQAWLQLLETPQVVPKAVLPSQSLPRKQVATPALKQKQLVSTAGRSVQQPSPSPARQPDAQPPQTTPKSKKVSISWISTLGWLLLTLPGYATQCFCLRLASAPFGIWALALAGAWAFAWAGARATDNASVRSVAFLWAWVWALALTRNLAGDWSWPIIDSSRALSVSFGWGWAVAEAGGELRKFGPRQTFWTLGGVSAVGLVLGWWFYGWVMS
jgi:serine/threonine protein kinase